MFHVKHEEQNMNIGQYTSDLIRLANRLQKEASSTDNPIKIYSTVVEIKDLARQFQDLLVKEYLDAKS
jgi:hypothetical protein